MILKILKIQPRFFWADYIRFLFLYKNDLHISYYFSPTSLLIPVLLLSICKLKFSYFLSVNSSSSTFYL